MNYTQDQHLTAQISRLKRSLLQVNVRQDEADERIAQQDADKETR